jgi:adenosylcobinamide kinase/adenosylcobinamide-phosphate guanylyltransferase
MAFILLLGGARSGKSALATELAKAGGSPVTVVATAQALDPEMSARIEQHRAARPSAWTTVEEPLALLQAVERVPERDLLVIDCLTLWVSNLMGQGEAEPSIVAAATQTATALARRPTGAVVVSNEVGLGIIPTNPLARAYRDILGRVNAVFAAQAARAVLMVAGRLHELTSVANFMEGVQWQPR